MKMNPKLEQLMIKNLESVCRITNRALSGKPTVVKVQISSTVAMTDGRNITLSQDFPNSGDLEFFEKCAVWKGLNYHELAHVIFTENVDRWSLTGDMFRAFNLLEDARIEWLMSHCFPGTRKYFINNIAKLGITDNVVVWGRRYMLPFKVQTPNIPGRALEIIDDFICSKSLDERIALAKEFATLIPSHQGIGDWIGNFDLVPMAKRRGEKAKELQCKANEAIEKLKSMKEADKQNINGDSEHTEYGLLNPETQRSNIPAEESEQKKYDSLREAIEYGELDEEFEDAVQEITDQIAPHLHRASFSQQGTSPILGSKVIPDPTLSQQLYRIFSSARLYSESYYEKRMSGGKIDTKEAMLSSRSSSPRIFKRYQENSLDELKMSLAILLDKSGSMCSTDPKGISKHAGSALVSSAARANFEVLALAFDGSCQVVKSPQERGFRDYEFSGGTCPYEVLNKTEEFFKGAQYSPCMIFFSDGDFSGQSYQILEKLGSKYKSVYVVAFGQGLGTFHEKAPSVLVREIRSIREFPRIVREIIKTEEKRRLKSAGREWW